MVGHAQTEAFGIPPAGAGARGGLLGDPDKEKFDRVCPRGINMPCSGYTAQKRQGENMTFEIKAVIGVCVVVALVFVYVAVSF